jgi:hypothetical protein
MLIYIDINWMLIKLISKLLNWDIADCRVLIVRDKSTVQKVKQYVKKLKPVKKD